MLTSAGLPSKAEDCSIISINDKGDKLISNIDIFTAIHDDPYMMGKIAACNVTNDLFALNALNVSNYSAFIGVPTDIPKDFPVKIIDGMRDFLKDIETDVHGGHTIYNPWPLFGGSASAIIKNSEIIGKRGIKMSDRLILTKPLGVQPIMAAYRVMKSEIKLLDDYNLDEIKKSIDTGVKCMTTSNRNVVKVIHEGNFFNSIHAMTDITGFGFAGHLEEMLEDSNLGADISQIPVIPTTVSLADYFGYRLREGFSPEIAGPMLIAVDPKEFDNFIHALEDNNVWWFEVGKISKKHQSIKFQEKNLLIEVADFK
nr:selenide, water dikinase SelD [Candidatus Prometheoarchaeum syntrophicum]